MGNCCVQAESNQFEERSEKDSETFSQYSNGPLTLEDINARITAPVASKTVRMKDFELQFAFVSQRGYYPDALKKPNQDSFVCAPKFMGNKNQALFGVFDGHGSYGDVCAKFAADKLPANVAKMVEEKGVDEDSLGKAHVLTNEQMHKAPFDDSMSGTTAVSVFFDGNEIHVANVGDSRAIIAQEDQNGGGKTNVEVPLIAKPLSIDQTPFRKDERDRVKLTGARVLTVDQLEGVEPLHEDWGVSLGEEIDESGDPPRIWHPMGDYPGTAFTRSLGDSVSEELGVFAVPEVVSKTLNKHDKFIVIASDGVFEFITSQTVVNMVNEHDNPLDACRVVVEEAYNRWLQYEIRTDDITMICIFLKGITKQREALRGSIYAGADTLDMADMQRPVRGIGTRDTGKRDTILGVDGVRFSIASTETNGSLDDDEVYVVADHAVAKSKADENHIRNIVKSNFLFANLLETKLVDIISVMKPQTVKAGEIVIRQHEAGDCFYVVSTGEFEVRVAETEGEVLTSDNPVDYGQVIHVYKASGSIHPTFGDLALIYSKPRAATIVATTIGKLWKLDRLAFRSILMKRPLRDVIQALRQVAVLAPLSMAQTQRLAEEMSEVTFEPKTNIIVQGEVGEAFYLITEGSVTIQKTSKGADHPEEVGRLDANHYFGERALLTNEPRAASVVATEKTTCLTIRREAFELSLGSLSAIIEHHYSRQKKLDDIAEARTQASKSSFYLVSDADETAPDLVSITLKDFATQVEITENLTNLVRLHQLNLGDHKMVTTRTAAKQEVYDAGIHRQLVGEQDIYASLFEHCPVVPELISMCTTPTDIYLLYDQEIVGTLHEVLESGAQSEAIAKFCGAEMLVGLEYLHTQGILCRGIDPARILVDRLGHLKLMNMRLAKYVGTGRTYTICGKVDYFSPEIIGTHGHDIMSDYWALGILLYEILVGETPFASVHHGELELFNAISTTKPEDLSFPDTVSPEAKSIVCGLLALNEKERLGYRNAMKLHESVTSEIRSHAFFKDIQWESLSSAESPIENITATMFAAKETASTEAFMNVGKPYTGDVAWLKNF